MKEEIQADGVYLTDSGQFHRPPIKGISRSVKAGNHDAGVVIHSEPVIAAMRGRNPDKPNSQEKGIHTEQRLEVNGSGVSNTLTSVQKDNLVLEPKDYRFHRQALETLQENTCEIGDTIDAYNKRVSKSGISPTITTRTYGFKTSILPVVKGRRVRKLTPRECWRLMGWTDRQFDKVKWYTREENEELLRKYPNHKGKRQFTREGRIEKMNDSQLYKQAGNGIVIQVLEAIFRRMFLEQPENGVQPNTEGQMEFIFLEEKK